MQSIKETHMKALKLIYKLTKGFILFCLVILGFIFIISLLPLENNFKVFTVQSGSMEPEIRTGSVIFVKNANSYEKGDVITRKNIGNSKITVTHRIVEKETSENGTLFRTKGDANEDADSETFAKEEIIGKVLFNIPFLGYPINFMKTTLGFILLIVIPTTILIYEEMRKIKKEITSKLSKKKGSKKEKRNFNELPEKEQYFAEKIKGFEFSDKNIKDHNEGKKK